MDNRKNNGGLDQEVSEKAQVLAELEASGAEAGEILLARMGLEAATRLSRNAMEVRAHVAATGVRHMRTESDLPKPAKEADATTGSRGPRPSIATGRVTARGATYDQAAAVAQVRGKYLDAELKDNGTWLPNRKVVNYIPDYVDIITKILSGELDEGKLPAPTNDVHGQKLRQAFGQVAADTADSTKNASWSARFIALQMKYPR